MFHSMLRLLLPAVAVVMAVGCSKPAQDAELDTPLVRTGVPRDAGRTEPLPLTLRGAVQKGPFVIGSSVSVSPLNTELVPTGQIFNTQTSNDRGEFEIAVTVAGPISLQGEGFYFNELTGQLSEAALTLRAFYAADPSEGGTVFINMVTHITANRVKALVGAGAEFASAVNQAEQELLQELNITRVGYQPRVNGVAMDVAGADTDDNAYLLAVSATLIQVAIERGGSIDAALQEALNAYAFDLADDGSLNQARKDEVAAALRLLQVDSVELELGRRLAALGSSERVPDMRRVLDQSRCCRHGSVNWGCRVARDLPACDEGMACAVGPGCEAWTDGCCLPAGADGQTCLPSNSAGEPAGPGSTGSCAPGLACTRGDPASSECGFESCCTPGGAAGQPCLSGEACNDGLSCVDADIAVPQCSVARCCVPGGAAAQPCFADGSCNPGLVCRLRANATQVCNREPGCCVPVEPD